MIPLTTEKKPSNQGITVILPFAVFYGFLLLVAHFSPASMPKSAVPNTVGTESMMQSPDPKLNRLRTVQLTQTYKHYQKYRHLYQTDAESITQEKCSMIIQNAVFNYNSIAEQTSDSVFVKTGLPRRLPGNAVSVAAQ